MLHPILKSANRMRVYSLLWVSLSVFQSIFIFYQFREAWIAATFCILVQNLLLFTLLFGAWYGIRYINLETQSAASFFFNHLVYVVLILLFWFALTQTFEAWILKDKNPTYQNLIAAIKLLLGFFSYLLYVAFVYLDAYYTSYLEKQENESKLYASLKESELNLLKTQMNPHFIFNSLNSISSLTMISPERAQHMIIQLSDFLRYTVNATHKQKVSLEKELEMCKAYLEIEKIRFGSKLQVEMEIDPDALSATIPSMILQTLFENALKHGVYPSLNIEQIQFKAHKNHNRLEISISNTYDPDAPKKTGTQTGLQNIKNRLDIIYDYAALFEITDQNQTFTVFLNIPI